jgi:hypothetical protein
MTKQKTPEIRDSNAAFTREELVALRKGLTQMFEELGIKVHMKTVKTSKKSVSLYIRFVDRDMRMIRISSHKPVFSQLEYINIY